MFNEFKIMPPSSIVSGFNESIDKLWRYLKAENIKLDHCIGLNADILSSSLKRSLEPLFHMPCKRFVKNRWTLSILTTKHLRWGDQTAEQYSGKGRMPT